MARCFGVNLRRVKVQNYLKKHIEKVDFLHFFNLFWSMVPGFVSWVLGIVCWVLGSVFWVSGIVFWVSGIVFWVLGLLFWVRPDCLATQFVPVVEENL